MTDENASDDGEYELEPIDPEVLKHQEERARRKTREAEDSVDINEVFDSVDADDPVDFDSLKQFRFTTRHLLILTAVLAVVMTMVTRQGPCMGLFVSSVVALAAGWWFVLREESRRLAKIEADRQRFRDKLAARRAVEDGKPLPPPASDEQFEQLNAAWEDENDQEPSFKFAFSTKELLLTFTVAALILGFAQVLGASNAALLLGLIALVGLLVQAFGVYLPPVVILGWWMLMVMYIVLSVWATISPSGD